MARMRARRSSSGMSIAWSKGVGKAVHVVRIDDHRFTQFLRRAGQPAQHQHAIVIVARGHELLGDKVHPVVQRADDAEVGEAVERDEARNRQRLGVVVNRRRTAGHPMARVDCAMR